MTKMMDQRSESLRMCGSGGLVYQRGNKRVWKQLESSVTVLAVASIPR